MKLISLVGIVLIILGVVGFVAGGISYTTDEKVVDMGPIEVEAEHTKSFPATPLASGLALVCGAALVFAGQKQK